uniref:Cytochrome P450 n=1 Tax=Quercus lobata TaxID=97700 RepID=A0A7N2KTG5_QUELO
MIFDFSAKQLFSYEPEKAKENIAESFTNFLQGLMSFPINIPGTAYHRCLQNQKKAINLITTMFEERKRNPEIRRGDFLDQILADMKTETFFTDNFIIYMMFGLLIASFETISSTLTLAIMLINDHPKVVQALTEDHDAILKNREDVNSGLTWKEYKSMTFTHTDISANVAAKNFIPFGAGMTSCAGDDLFTKYRWTTIKGGEVIRSPTLGFGDGFYIQASAKHK